MISTSLIPDSFVFINNKGFAKNLVEAFNLPFEYLSKAFHVILRDGEPYHVFALDRKNTSELVIFEGESMVYNGEETLKECIDDILENY